MMSDGRVVKSRVSDSGDFSSSFTTLGRKEKNHKEHYGMSTMVLHIGIESP